MQDILLLLAVWVVIELALKLCYWLRRRWAR